jgi:hypothetical protein
MIPEYEIRENFETWLKVYVRKRIGREPDLSRLPTGLYVNPEHERRWEAWRAAVWEYGGA